MQIGETLVPTQERPQDEKVSDRYNNHYRNNPENLGKTERPARAKQKANESQKEK